jgi:hypothetical protein
MKHYTDTADGAKAVETPLTREQIERFRAFAHGGHSPRASMDFWPMVRALCDMALRTEQLERDGPTVRAGSNDDGTPWMCSMREALAHAEHAAKVEAGHADHFRRELAEAKRDAEPKLYQDLDPELRWILGQICFMCINTATSLRKMGHEIPTKAEDEQAASINWMLGLYAAHGKGWRVVAVDILKRADAAMQTEGGTK